MPKSLEDEKVYEIKNTEIRATEINNEAIIGKRDLRSQNRGNPLSINISYVLYNVLRLP